MIYGKRDPTGLYQDNRHKTHLHISSNADKSLETSSHSTKSAATRLPFAERVKAMFRDLRGARNIALNKNRSYEIEIFPSHLQSHIPGIHLTGVHAGKPNKQVGALLVSGKSDQRWSGRKENGRNEMQTPSNLG